MLWFFVGMLLGAIGTWVIRYFDNRLAADKLYDCLTEDEEIICEDAMVILNTKTQEWSWYDAESGCVVVKNGEQK